jgi:hypothetical protein
LLQRRIVHAVFLQERIKTAKLAYMRRFHAGDVIGSGASRLRHIHNLVGWNKQEFRLLVYEACDQPETGNSVNFRTLSRDPAYKHSFKKTVNQFTRSKTDFPAHAHDPGFAIT